ncbi:hypothetical protein I8F73_04410 [Enterococcus faecalis]|nr:hypothetical protein [Enterococcus faecalis]
MRALFGIDRTLTDFINQYPVDCFTRERSSENSSSIYYSKFTLSLSFFLWIWQQVPLEINLQHDLLIVSLLAGLVAGGRKRDRIYRMGGTAGGSRYYRSVFRTRITASPWGVLYWHSISSSCLLQLNTISNLKHDVYIDHFLCFQSLVIDSILDGIGYSAKGLCRLGKRKKLPLLMTGATKEVSASLASPHSLEIQKDHLHGRWFCD